MEWLRRLAEAQARWSARLDEALPAVYQADGNRDFLDRLVPRYLEAGAMVYDVGGGKNPVVDRGRKQRLGLTVAGIDIDASELAAAPEGSYDRTISADIAAHRGEGDGDLVICQALLEHVTDTGRALEAIAGLLKPGGRALIFVPCRNAVYARANLLLPQELKRRILFGIFPEMSRDHGFRAYYDRCTPGGIERNAARCGLEAERLLLYFRSDYFRFCFPLHAAWRAWVMLFRSVAGAQAAETFSFVFRKAA
jgi:SAM-dependent methyltransferase